uniref:non-specific serine/threonine protein kinase n=1 Tax=Hordeum vulgare subsp. vulgare TaxID=112509 RepID=A0A8I7BK89_HORVV
MDRLGGITQTDLEYMLHDEDAEPMAMPFPLLEKITDYFSDESIIGRGGYAVVHKAVLDNGTVAVKKLSNTHMNEKLFLREVECLMKAKHRNIVRFLGYCSDTQGNIFDYDGKKIMADVRQRLLCYEYLRKGSLDNYIKDSLGELKWRKRYHIIKGICDGLNYLHENYILHLDLKPGNILLDDDMMPKITDFGSSRCLEKGQTRVITKHVAGTIGYLAPECYRSEITITHKVDLYSLGVIIMELLTGKKGCGNIEDVRESWSYKSDILWWEQIRVCAEIGIECIDLIPANRPQSMKHIIDRLLVAESSTHVVPTGGVNKLLALHTSALRFTFEANKVIMCPLQLTNNTNKHVAFRLMDKSGQSSFLRLPLYGVVPPNNPYILIVTTEEKKMLPRKWIIDVILGTAIILGDDKHIKTFQCQPEKYFQDMLNEVQEVKLKALYTLPRDIITSSSKPISPRIKINFLQIDELSTYCFDTNHAKQWIITGHDRGYVRIWDYKTQRKVDSLKISATHAIKCVKFIARMKWIVAGTKNTDVHVYNFETMQKITSFRIAVSGAELVSLAIHPTQPYLLSVDFYIKLWDWDKNWECIRTFEYQNYLTCPVVLNPNNSFATASGDCTVEIWSFDSPNPTMLCLGTQAKLTAWISSHVTVKNF